MGFKSRNLVAFISWLGLCLLSLIVYTSTTPHTGSDSPTCRMSYMNPAYARIKAFDESHTKYASKYSLYLYKEQHRDPIPSPDEELDLNGIPILFIPGNAGSFRQVRSIAAETANVYYDEFQENPHVSHYDYFTADFNEDFTAFHGRTMLDQAEYLNEAIKFILQLYSKNDNPPTSVVILGHSMGGVVARVMVTLPSYLPNSINTIITLSSPHAAAPLTFDGDILKLYSSTDRFWYDAYDNNSIAHQRLANTSLISITGGMLDDVLPADYTTLGFLVPPSNGFTVFSTGIPEVWTPIDHLAIVWCAQLRRKLALVLLNIADITQPERTVALPKRMKVFRDHLLTGFEHETIQDKLFNQPDRDLFNLKLDNDKITAFDETNIFKVDKRVRRKRQDPHFSMFKLPRSHKLSIISSIPFTVWKEFTETKYINPSILLCSHKSTTEHELFDFTSDKTRETTTLECSDITLDQRNIPWSMFDTKSLQESSIGGDHPTFYGFDMNCDDFTDYDTVIIADRLNPRGNDVDMIVAQLSDKTKYELSGDLTTLVTSGSKMVIPNHAALCTNIHIPGAWSSLLSYRLKLNQTDYDESSFSPIVRQWSNEPYETKWHIDLKDQKQLSLSVHGIAPFTPFKVSNNTEGLNVELWNDLTVDSGPLEISITIDWFSSLKLLIIRYRLALVASCVLIMLFIITVQLKLKATQRTKKYPPLIQGLQSLTNPVNFAIIVFVLSILTPIVKIPIVQHVLDLIDPVVLRDSNEINLSLHRDFKLNSFYLGLEENCLFFIGPIFFIIGIGLIYLSYYLLLILGVILSKSIIKLHEITTRKVKSEKTTPILLSPQIQGNENTKLQILWKYRRYVIGTLVILSIPIYLPYQFVFIVCCIIQAFKLIRIMITQYQSKDINTDNIFNYQISFLLLMLWILPINVPILIVFVHNLAVNWRTPFSSHHNILSIIPIIFLIEKHTVMEVLPKFGHKSSNLLIKIIIYYCYYCIFYCVVYGIRHTFWLHHLFNILCCLILLTFLEDSSEDERTCT